MDFDDGHCPTWRNTVQGLYNVTAAVHHNLQGGPADITIAPILMMRPRAFNMIEHHCMVSPLCFWLFLKFVAIHCHFNLLPCILE